MYFLSKKNKKSEGFALTELLIAVGIIAILGIAIMARMNSTNNKRLVTTEVENVTELASGIRNLYGAAGAANYTGLTNAVALNSNAVPISMRNPPNISNSWAPAGVTLGVVGAGAQYTITSTAVPQEFCTEIASLTLNMFVTTTVNGGAVTDPATASAACNVAANRIVWTGS